MKGPSGHLDSIHHKGKGDDFSTISRMTTSNFQSSIAELSSQLDQVSQQQSHRVLSELYPSRSRISLGAYSSGSKRHSLVSGDSSRSSLVSNARDSLEGLFPSIEETDLDQVVQDDDEANCTLNEDCSLSAADEEYVRLFADRCASMPGYVPIISGIEKELSNEKCVLFPVIMAQAIDKLTDFMRTEDSLPPKLRTSLVAGASKSIIVGTTSNDEVFADHFLVDECKLSEAYLTDVKMVLFLQSLPCCLNFTEKQIHQIIDCLNPIQFSAYELPVKEGDVLDQMFIVLSGRLRQVRFVESIDDYFELGELSSGSTFGMWNLFIPAPSTHGLFAAESGTLLSLSRSDYMAIVATGYREQNKTVIDPLKWTHFQLSSDEKDGCTEKRNPWKRLFMRSYTLSPVNPSPEDGRSSSHSRDGTLNRAVGVSQRGNESVSVSTINQGIPEMSTDAQSELKDPHFVDEAALDPSIISSSVENISISAVGGDISPPSNNTPPSFEVPSNSLVDQEQTETETETMVHEKLEEITGAEWQAPTVEANDTKFMTLSHHQYMQEEKHRSQEYILSSYVTELSRALKTYGQGTLSYDTVTNCLSVLSGMCNGQSVFCRLLNYLSKSFLLSGVCMFTNTNNKFFSFKEGVGVQLAMDERQMVNSEYVANIDQASYACVNSPICSSVGIYGMVVCARRIPPTQPENSGPSLCAEKRFTELEIQLIQWLCNLVPSFFQTPDSLSMVSSLDCPSTDCLSFTLNSIKVIRLSSSHMVYRNCVFSISLMFNGKEASEPIVFPMDSGDTVSLSRQLNKICNKLIESKFAINKLGIDYQLFFRFVAGKNEIIGMLPLFDSQGILISGKQFVYLCDKHATNTQFPCAYRNDNCCGILVIQIAKDERSIVYSATSSKRRSSFDKNIEIIQKTETKMIESLKLKTAMDPLSDAERSLLHTFHGLCDSNPYLSVMLAQSLDMSKLNEVNLIYQSIPSYLSQLNRTYSAGNIEDFSCNQRNQYIGQLFLLLSLRNKDRIIREIVVKQLDSLMKASAEYLLYVSQLIHALKWEAHDNNALIRLLLRKSLEDHAVARALYWQLQGNCDDSMVRSRFLGYMRLLVFAIPGICIDTGCEYILVRQLMTIAINLKDSSSGESKNESLRTFMGELPLSSTFFLPLYPDLPLSGLVLKDCRVMSSKKQPLFLTMGVSSDYSGSQFFAGKLHTKQDLFRVMVKKGDDIRKDQLIQSFIRILALLLEQNGIENRMQYYACLSTSEDEGLIEIVDNSVTIGSIFNYSNSIANKLEGSESMSGTVGNKLHSATRSLLNSYAIQEHIVSNSTYGCPSIATRRAKLDELAKLQVPRVLKPLDTMEDNTWTPTSLEMIPLFIRSKLYHQSPLTVNDVSRNVAISLGQYTMFIYLFGVGDRHNDNIMINDHGVFHIDFGHILGHYKKKFGLNRETRSFLFTKAYYCMLGGEKHPLFGLFMKNVLDTYMIMRTNHLLFYSLCELMRQSGVDDCANEQDTMFFYKRCMLDKSESEAKEFIEREVKRGVNDVLPMINDFFHLLYHG